jgi:hypothetical protein
LQQRSRRKFPPADFIAQIPLAVFDSYFRKYPREREGQRPSLPEEEAKPDDETKSLRAQALNLKTARTPGTAAKVKT